MGVWQRLLGRAPKKVDCSKCGDRFLNLAGAMPPYVCARCQTFARAAAEIDLRKGIQIPGGLPPLPTLKNNVRPLAPWSQLPEGSPGSRCPGCGSTLWRLRFVTLRPMEAVTEGSRLLLPHGAGTEITLDECPHPECPLGWQPVRDATRNVDGLPTELHPPWAGFDPEGHAHWWHEQTTTPGAGKGVTAKGMFGPSLQGAATTRPEDRS